MVETAALRKRAVSSSPRNFKLKSKVKTGRASYILTFADPESLLSGLPVPSGVKLNLFGRGKSYSPVSLPGSLGANESDEFDLLVKPYPDAPGGGFGKFLCDLEPGEEASMTVKKPRVIHGETDVIGRRDYVNLVGGGTGIAPLVQIARAEILAGRAKRIRMICASRGADDALMRKELDEMQEASDSFDVTYLDTSKFGRGDVELARSSLVIDPANSLTYVCGTDGFVDFWAGSVERDENGKKVQGNLRGILFQAGLRKDGVYKF